MRRRPAQPESMEMLLDTMCNAFGGIILIALLVTLLVRETQRVEARERQAEHTAERDRRRLERLEADFQKAMADGATLTVQAADPAISNLLHLVSRRDTLRQHLEAVREKSRLVEHQLNVHVNESSGRIEDLAGRLISEHEALDEVLARTRNRLVEDASQVHALRRREQDLELQTQAMEEKRVRRFRFPREHETRRMAWLMVLRYGKVYPVRVALGQGQSAENRATLNWMPVSNLEDLVVPIRDRGLSVGAAVASWGSLMGAVSTQDHYLAFFVYEDSFPGFLELRDHAVRQGFTCGWEPFVDGQVLILTRGTGSNPSPQ